MLRMTFEEYSAIDAEHWSRLKLLLKSPAHYKANIEDESEDDDTDTRVLGRVFHMLTLEPHLAKSRLAVWEGKTRRGKEWDAFCADNRGKEWVRRKELDKASAMADAALTQCGDLLKDGVAEGSIVWTQNGVKCKARPDYVKPELVLDLKSTTDGGPAEFGKQAARLGYHCQAAMYLDAVDPDGRPQRDFVLLACESKPPFVCTPYLVPLHVIEAGQRKYQHLLAQLSACKALDTWGGYANGVAELAWPEWAE